MFTYNTTKEPIILKDYGRYIQNLINKIARIPDIETQTTHINNLIPILQNIISKNSKTHSETAQIWSDAYIASNHQLNINAPCPLPSKEPIQKNKQTLQPNTLQTPFKCCGKNLVKLIHILFTDIENNPNAQEIIILLAKIIQQTHKKTKSTLLTHLEQVAQKKIPFPHTDIEKKLPN